SSTCARKPKCPARVGPTHLGTNRHSANLLRPHRPLPPRRPRPSGALHLRDEPEASAEGEGDSGAGAARGEARIGGSPHRWAAPAVRRALGGGVSNPCNRPSPSVASVVVVAETPHSGQPGQARRTQARPSRIGSTPGAW